MPRKAALLASAAATLMAALGMLLLRSRLQLRTVPERLLEWLLLFVSPREFEAGLQRFGFDAKRYALAAAVLVLLLALGGLGYFTLRRGWTTRAILAVGVGLWLFVMLVIMPLTAAGPFGLELLDGKRAVIGGYLAVALTFAAILATARWVHLEPSAGVPAKSSRRAAMAILGSAGSAYIGTYLLITLLPRGSRVAFVVLDANTDTRRLS